MDELLGTIKSLAIKAIGLFLIIVVVILFAYGPSEAADFAKWVGSGIADAGNSIKILIQELRN